MTEKHLNHLLICWQAVEANPGPAPESVKAFDGILAAVAEFFGVTPYGLGLYLRTTGTEVPTFAERYTFGRRLQAWSDSTIAPGASRAKCRTCYFASDVEKWDIAYIATGSDRQLAAVLYRLEKEQPLHWAARVEVFVRNMANIDPLVGYDGGHYLPFQSDSLADVKSMFAMFADHADDFGRRQADLRQYLTGLRDNAAGPRVPESSNSEILVRMAEAGHIPRDVALRIAGLEDKPSGEPATP